jgi:t-SNARE complex subunit (syntaxin)
MRESLEKQSEMERGIFRNELKEKSTRIAKLEKEIAYLTTLLNNMLENQSYADYDK